MAKLTPVKPGDIIELDIDGLGHTGEGVGRYQGLAIFVPGALPDERVRAVISQVKKSYARGKLIEVVTRTTDRILPRCPAAADCGGCQLQHLDYQAQLTHKTTLVKSALTRIGGLNDVPVRPTIGMEYPWHYRNKIHLHATQSAGRIKLGFFAEGTHQLTADISEQSCLLVNQEIIEVVAAVEELLNSFKIKAYDWESKQGLLRHVMIRRGYATGEIMVVLVTTAENWLTEQELAREIVNRHPRVVSVIRNINTNPGRLILGPQNQVLAGKDSITDRLCGLKFKISAASFYQVNPRQTEVLYNKALEFANLKGDETVVDAYCGIGTIASLLARHADRVIGLEIVPDAVADARENARLNNLFNIEFFNGSVERLLPEMVALGLRPDLVVLDPPRRGCEKEVLEAIIKTQVPRVVYVSCDPATLARDLGILAGAGYEPAEVQPVDMFPWTGHVECVVLITKL